MGWWHFVKSFLAKHDGTSRGFGMTRTEGVRKSQVTLSPLQDVMRRFKNMLQPGWPLPVVNGPYQL